MQTMTNDKYKNQYRTKSTRLQNWDYGQNGSYFITICTEKRVHYFGEITNEKMQLSDIGKIVESEWLATFEMRPDMNLTMGEFVIMPNHFHAIISIGDNSFNTHRGGGRDAMHCVSTVNCVSTAQNKFGPQSKNLGSIVRGFKSGVTKNARIINPDFGWQRNYWEHIVRNENEYQRITQYIMDNPKKWALDKLNGGTGNSVMEPSKTYNQEAWMI